MSNISGAYVRRQEMVATEAELATYGSKVLLENEVLYVKMSDGTIRQKMGDGVTAVKNLPFTKVFDGSVLQDAGDSEVSVMSQKVTSAMLFDGMRIIDGEDLYWYVSFESGEAVKSGAYFRLYLFLNPKFKYISVFAASTDTKPAAITFYSDYAHEGETFDGSMIDSAHYMGGVQMKKGSTNGNWHSGFVPDGCKAVVVCTRTDASGFSPKILVDSASVFASEIEGLKTKESTKGVTNPFLHRKFYGHLFVDKTNADSDIVIPCQSIFDIDATARLGFSIIEANVHKTLDGRYVTMHGESGYLGGQVVAINGGSDPLTTKFSDLTFDQIRSNYVYRSKYAKYQTKITSLEEFLTESRKRNLVPFVQYVDGEMVEIVRSIVGDDFILYNGTRKNFGGMIYRWGNSSDTKDDILALVDSIGAPMMYGINGIGRFTDEELTEILHEVHKRGCLVGWAGSYGNGPSNSRMQNLGFDFSGSAWDVDDFESGNLVNARADVDFSDFTTNGTISGNVLSLAEGQTISISNLDPQFLAKGVLKVMFNGNISIGMGYKHKNDRRYTSDGSVVFQFGTYFLEEAPIFNIKASTDTTILMVDYKASKC